MIRALIATRGFARPYRGALALGALCAVAEVAVGLAMPWPLAYIVDQVLTPAATAAGPGADPGRRVLVAVVALLGLVAATSLLDYWSTRLLAQSGLRMGADLREQVFAHLQRLSLGFHGKHRVGDLTARVTADVDRTQDMLVQTLAVLVPNALLVVGMFGVMLVVDPTFTLVVALTTPAMIWAVVVSARRLRVASRRARRADGQVAAAATEGLGAIHLVQALTLEGPQRERFGDLARSSLAAGLETARVQARFSPIVDVTSALATAAVLLVGARRVIDGDLRLGVLLVFLAYVGSLYKPIKQLAKLSAILARGAAAAERMIEVLREQPQIADRRRALRPTSLRGEVELRGVGFGYGREQVLVDVDLAIPAGQTVALVGPTGAGKSTLASLVPRLIDPTGGVVRVDGVDVRDYAVRALRAQIALVPQESVLLSGTLRDNIAWGRPGASDAEIERAARLALVDEFACRLPDGLATPIGERGHDLPGGQRQRVAIARAILRDAPILILDEPTSALDAASEELIVEALSNLPRGRTTIVIAHRLSTIRRADAIAVLASGRVVEHGTHGDLIGRGGLYAELVRAQGGVVPAPPAVRAR